MERTKTEAIKIGIVGFSRNQFDQKAAYQILEREFGKLFEKFNERREVEIVSGYTAMGVPKIAYELADKFQFTKVGFSAQQAFSVKCGLCEVHKEMIVGHKFGDESAAFVAYINGLIRIGGGKQSRREVELFKILYQHLPIERILIEYEVDWYGQ